MCLSWSMKADLVHIHAVGPALLVPLAKLLGLTVVFTSHGPDYRKNKWGRLARVVLRCGEYTVGMWVRLSLLSLLGDK